MLLAYRSDKAQSVELKKARHREQMDAYKNLSLYRRFISQQEEEEAAESFVPLREAFRIAGISINLIHGSEDAEAAAKEVAHFWPLEHAFMIVKPSDEDHTHDVEKAMHDAGLVIGARKTLQLTKEDVQLIYANNLDKEFYPELEEYMMR